MTRTETDTGEIAADPALQAPAPEPVPPSRVRDALAAMDEGVGRVARVVATAGALTMLGVALVTTFDVVILRWIFNAPIPGSNEIFHTVFPTAIAAVLAAGLSARATLEIDLLGLMLKARTIAWLRAFGAVLFTVTVALIAYAVWRQTLSAFNQGKVTTIMQWRLWPWYSVITAFFVLCIPAQLMVALRASADLTRRWYVGVIVVFALGLGLSAGAVWLFLSLQTFFLMNMLTAAAALVGLLWVLMLLYVPLAAALTACATLGILGIFGPMQAVNIAGAETKGLLISLDLAVVPFFLMMGGFAVQSGMSRDIYAFAQAIFAPFRGGLALATIGGSAGFGALTGSSVATVATIGSVAYPEMERRGYSPKLAAGAITSGGTLGQLLPPSTVAVVYALLVEQSIGAIYIAMLIPALMTVIFYMIAIGLTVTFVPSAAPQGEPWNGREIVTSGLRSLPVVVMFLLVFGGIFFGICTATEAAGLGAVIAFAILVLRGGLKGGGFWKVMAETTRSTSMIYFLIIGALITTFLFSATGLSTAMTDAVAGLNAPGWVIVVMLCAGYILLGFILDSMAIMMITASLTAGIVGAYGYDPIWWAVIMVVVVEIGVMTPPFGLNLFMLKSVAPKLPLSQLYAGVMPFLVADLIKLALLIGFPMLILWLPGFL
ncbi:TRAP transporter large permease subunit [Pararhodobacter sp.]|uniref:TRAP transporter large permease n=1 Tax=Pararhodobacter sp. TaxID=2127056 RepID=UPI002B003A15|nr:TRAP transporter large permease subunit [Pararhodobacter sp.]